MHTFLFLLMIIGYFNIEGIIFMPSKTNSPLFIDTDAMLSFSVPKEHF